MRMLRALEVATTAIESQFEHVTVTISSVRVLDDKLRF